MILKIVKIYLKIYMKNILKILRLENIYNNILVFSL